MAYGFNDDKSKAEVYTKDEVYSKNETYGKNQTYSKTELIDVIYPKGSIFMSVNNVNPGTYLSGTTWVAWGSGRMPVGVNPSQTQFNTVEKTGGAINTLRNKRFVPNQSFQDWSQALKDALSHKSITITAYTGQGNMVFSESGSSENDAPNQLAPYITCYMWKRTA